MARSHATVSRASASARGMTGTAEPENPNTTTAELDEEIAAIGSAPRHDLVRRWQDLTGRAPPAKISIETMRLVLAHHAQVHRFGDIPAEVARLLDRALLGETSDRSPAVQEPTVPPPGTRLLREWRGERHHVEVLETGYAYRGRVYRSLSEIARVFTGARWNGPRFFGLRSPRVMQGGDDG